MHKKMGRLWKFQFTKQDSALQKKIFVLFPFQNFLY